MKALKITLVVVSLALAVAFAVRLSISCDKAISKPTITSSKTVVIDAGHGGKDVGAVGVDGSLEKDINLEISLDLYDFLMVSGINSVMTRNGDFQTYYLEKDRTRDDLYNRMELVNSTPDSVLVSIHQNHFEDEREWGTQIWYSANNEESKALADSVLSSVKGLIQPDNKRSNKASDSSYYLLYKAKSPSIMVECGFTSNIEENKKLQNSEYQKNMAYSILLGLCSEV